MSNFTESTTTTSEKITMEDKIISIMQSISIGSGYALAATSFTFVVFLISEFLKKNSKNKSPYFAIYAITCMEPVSTVSAFILMRFIFPGIYFFEILNEFIWWYIRIFSPFANFILAFNRFTAVIFYMQYKYLWNKRHMIFIIAILFLYPFIVNGYSWIRLECRLYLIQCPEYFKEGNFGRAAFWNFLNKQAFSFKVNPYKFIPLTTFSSQTIYQALIYPHNDLSHVRAFLDQHAPYPIPSHITARYKQNKALAKQIIEHNPRNVVLLYNLNKIQDKTLVIENFESLLRKIPFRKDIWKMYFDYLKTIDNDEYERSLNLYSRYSRLFIDDLKIRNDYNFELIRQTQKGINVSKFWIDLIKIERSFGDIKEANRILYEALELSNYHFPDYHHLLIYSLWYFKSYENKPLLCHSLKVTRREITEPTYVSRSLYITPQNLDFHGLNNLTITNSFNIYTGASDHTICSKLLPKLKLNISCLFLSFQNLTLSEFQILSKQKLKICNLFNIEIQRENETFLDVVEIITMLPFVNRFVFSPRGEFQTLEISEKLSKLQRSVKFKRFLILKINQFFDCIHFIKFIKNNAIKNAVVVTYFSQDFPRQQRIAFKNNFKSVLPDIYYF